MTPLRSAIDVGSSTFASNRDHNLQALQILHKTLSKARAGGGERYQQRHVSRGKLLAHQRIELLLDRGSPFLELGALAGMHESGVVPGGSMMGGIGWVKGRPCVVTATDPTVSGGAINAWGLKRSARLDEVAYENRLVTLHCIESAGADLPNQANIFVPGGEHFRNIARRSREHIPTVSMVFGCLLYTSPSPRDATLSRMPSSA